MVGKMERFRHKKSLGQNFLNDKNILNKILVGTCIDPNSLIIEIGPGSGALTEKLIETNNNVLAFEIDTRLDIYLNKLEEKYSNFRVIYTDFLKANINEYLSKYEYSKLYVVANIPYYITSAIINKVIDKLRPDCFTIMIQKEVGSRLMAKPNTRDYNSLSLYCQFYYDISKICDVSKNCFIPKPDVDSVVLKFNKNDNKFKVADENEFFSLVKSAFKQKRKNLRNNLKQYDLNKIDTFLNSICKNLSYRAEQLSLDEFVSLYNFLNSEN